VGHVHPVMERGSDAVSGYYWYVTPSRSLTSMSSVQRPVATTEQAHAECELYVRLCLMVT